LMGKEGELADKAGTVSTRASPSVSSKKRPASVVPTKPRPPPTPRLGTPARTPGTTAGPANQVTRASQRVLDNRAKLGTSTAGPPSSTTTGPTTRSRATTNKVGNDTIPDRRQFIHKLTPPPVHTTLEVTSRRERPARSSVSATSTSFGTPKNKMIGMTTPSEGTPSRLDPLTRLRLTPGQESDRFRKTSNNSDIDIRLEQSRRTWLGGLGGDGDSPLTGRLGELKSLKSTVGVGPGSAKSITRVKRMSSQLGSKDDVFNKDKETIALLEARLEEMQQRFEMETSERIEREKQEQGRRMAVEMLNEFVRACDTELTFLQHRRGERERQVETFERIIETAVAGV
jgi:hypothetical protein